MDLAEAIKSYIEENFPPQDAEGAAEDLEVVSQLRSEVGLYKLSVSLTPWMLKALGFNSLKVHAFQAIGFKC